MWVMTGMEIENGSKLTHSFFPSSKYPPGSKYYSSHKYTCFLFQLVLCCQDAPELIAIKCYLALPGHCPQAQLKEKCNHRPAVADRGASASGSFICLMSYVTCPVLAPWDSEEHQK